jgi:hypothetical protein
MNSILSERNILTFNKNGTTYFPTNENAAMYLTSPSKYDVERERNMKR